MRKVLYRRVGRISHIVLSFAERRNAVDLDFIDDMKKCCTDFNNDDEAWVSIVSSAGDDFCVGADLLKGVPSVEFAKRSLAMLPSRVGTWKPIIAAVWGYCMGGGWMIVQDCDLRVASYDSKFSIPEVKWNFIPPFCAAFTHHHLRPIFSLEQILTAKILSGKRAYEIGFVNRVVEKEEVMNTAIELAERLCETGKNELIRRKSAFYEGMYNKQKRTVTVLKKGVPHNPEE